MVTLLWLILWGENIKDPWGWEIKHSNKTDREIIRVKEAEAKNKKKITNN